MAPKISASRPGIATEPLLIYAYDSKADPFMAEVMSDVLDSGGYAVEHAAISRTLRMAPWCHVPTGRRTSVSVVRR